MGEISRGTFIDEVPEMHIDGGLVIIHSVAGDYVMRPSTLRVYVERGRRLLKDWDAEQRLAIPFPKKP